ncbi:hypothetical protein C8Q80DRAFT_1115124, partial [Daedaleopsis nitida]
QPALVVGGSSSIGQYTIQMAKLQVFSPIVTTSSPKHAVYLKSIGATHILDRSLPPDVVLAELPKITGGKPLVYAYDAIAEDTTQNLAYDVLGPGGSLIVTDPFNTSILQPKIDRDRAAGVPPQKKVVRAMGSFASHANKALGEEVYKRLTEWLRTGVLVPNRVEVLPGGLAGVLEGCARIEGNKVSGVQLVLRPQETA